jgi:hypothetical protein
VLLGEIVTRQCDCWLRSAQAAQLVLSWPCVVSLALRVNVGFESRKTVARR